MKYQKKRLTCCFNIIQVHKGSLSKLREEYNNKTIDNKNQCKPKVTATVTKSEFIPVKDIIKDMEKEKQQYIDNKNDNILAHQKADSVVENKNEYNKIIEIKKDNQQEKNISSDALQQQIVPPKPLPRASRTGSICEPVEDLAPPKPVARPRTNSCVPVVTSVNPNLPIAGGYKVQFLLYKFHINFFLSFYFLNGFLITVTFI